tara:strand:- start:20 stop:145 length:126 start_codon:yes stop_codon:yes gene_type:complete
MAIILELQHLHIFVINVEYIILILEALKLKLLTTLKQLKNT